MSLIFIHSLVRNTVTALQHIVSEKWGKNTQHAHNKKQQSKALRAGKTNDGGDTNIIDQSTDTSRAKKDSRKHTHSSVLRNHK